AIAVHAVNSVGKTVADVHIAGMFITHDVSQFHEGVSDDGNAATGRPSVQVGGSTAGRSAAGTKVHDRFVVLDPEGASITHRRRGEQGTHYAIGIYLPRLAVFGIQDVKRAVRAHPTAVGIS